MNMPQSLQPIFVFIFGQPSQILWTAFMMILATGFVDLFQKKPFKEAMGTMFEKAFAYSILLMIANRIDLLAINVLFGWQGSSQFVACLYIFGRETKIITAYLAKRFGISIPFLEQRLHQMTQYQVPTQYQEQPEIITNNIDARMRQLREQLAMLEQQQRTQQQGTAPANPGIGQPIVPQINPQPLPPFPGQQPTPGPAPQPTQPNSPVPPTNPNNRPSI